MHWTAKISPGLKWKATIFFLLYKYKTLLCIFCFCITCMIYVCIQYTHISWHRKVRSVQLYWIILDEPNLSNCATAVTYSNTKLSYNRKKLRCRCSGFWHFLASLFISLMADIQLHFFPIYKDFCQFFKFWRLTNNLFISFLIQTATDALPFSCSINSYKCYKHFFCCSTKRQEIGNLQILKIVREGKRHIRFLSWSSDNTLKWHFVTYFIFLWIF